jgi:hypothetical protein
VISGTRMLSTRRSVWPPVTFAGFARSPTSSTLGPGCTGSFWSEAEEIVEAGNQVVAVERHAASGVKGSGAEGRVRHSFACLFTFRDGKVSQVKEYATRGEALKAAGLSE